MQDVWGVKAERHSLKSMIQQLEQDGSENMLAQTHQACLPTSAQSFPHHSRLLLFLRVEELHMRTWDLLVLYTDAA